MSWSCTLLMLVVLALRAHAEPEGIEIVFLFDAARAKEAYACTVTTSLHDKKKSFTGAIRSGADQEGRKRVTINAGIYKVYLGVHRRESAPEATTIDAVTYQAAQASKVMGAGLKAGFARAYEKRDGRYILRVKKGHDDYWKTRFALAVWDVASDRIRSRARPGTFRLCLVLEKDGEVPVTFPANGKRQGRKAKKVHVHSGPNSGRDAEGCLTIPEREWASFISPFLERFPLIDDWIVNVGYGKEIGSVRVGARPQRR